MRRGVLVFLPAWLLYLGAFQANVGYTDIQVAQNWFQQAHPTPKFLGRTVELNWNAARKVEHGGSKFYEVPLSESAVFAFGIGNLDENQSTNTTNASVNGQLRLVIAQNGTNYAAYYLQVSGTKTYLDTKGEAKVLLTNFDQIQSDFTGIMEYFDMDGKHIDGWYFENGVANQPVFTFNQGNKVATMDRCLTCTQTTTTWQIVVSSGGYVNTYWEVSSTINCSAPTYFNCYDPPFYPPGYYYYPWGMYVNSPGNNPGNIENEEKPCKLTGIWESAYGPEITWSPMPGFFNFCSVNTAINATLTDCKNGTVAAISGIESVGNFNCGGTINREQTIIKISKKNHLPVQKTWEIETTNQVTVNFSFVFMGASTSGSSTGTNFTPFKFTYL